MPKALNAQQNKRSPRGVLKEIRERLSFLLDRPQLPDAGARLRHPLRRREPAHPAGVADPGSGLTGVLYVLDEPRSACTSDNAAAGNPEAAARSSAIP